MATAAAYALTRTVRRPNSQPNHVRTLSRCTNTPTLVLSGMTVMTTSLESIGPFRKVLRRAYSVARAVAGATAAARGLAANALAPAWGAGCVACSGVAPATSIGPAPQ